MGGRPAPFEVGDHVGALRDGVGTAVGGDHPEPPQRGRRAAGGAGGDRHQPGAARRRRAPRAVHHRSGRRRPPPTPGPRSPGVAAQRRATGRLGRPVAGPAALAGGRLAITRVPAGHGGPAKARRPTAAAPTSGPWAPSPPGMIRVDLEKSSRDRRAISSWAASKKTPPKPRATEPGHHGQLDVEEVGHRGHRPSDQRPGASTHRLRAPRRPGARSSTRSTVPDASASRQPRPPQAQGRPSGSTTTWPMWPALPGCPVEQSSVDHDASPDPGGHHHGQVVGRAPGRTQPALAEGQGLGVVVHGDRQPDTIGQALPEREPDPCPDVEGTHRLAVRPTSDRHTPRRTPPARRRRPTGPVRSAPPGRRTPPRDRTEVGVATRASARMAPQASTTAAAILVPPMSTASTTGPAQVAGPGSPGPTRPSDSARWSTATGQTVPAGRTGHSSRWKRPRIQSRGSCTVLLRLRLWSDREMSSMPALPIRRALLAKTTPGQEHHHHADEPEYHRA